MKKLGNTNIKVSELGLGCFALGGPFKGRNGRYLAYGPVSDDESRNVIHKAIDLGINFFDTADVYGCGHSEKILGSVLSDYDREDIVIATKFSNEFDEKTKTVIGKNVKPEYIAKALDASLKRLRTTYIDLYQLHDSQHDIESARRIIDVLDNFVEEGKILSYGWSTDDIKRARIFAEEGKHCSAVQYAIHLTRSNPQMIELCEQYHLTGLIRSPLGSGILTGKYSQKYMKKLPKDHMWYDSKFLGEEWFLNRQIKLHILKNLLDTEGDGRSLIQTLLSYLWSTSKTTIPIPGAKSIQQIEENAETLKYGPIKPNLLNKINSLFEDIRNSV